ncbi:MAG: UDP-2,3-diacylglucosamine diphosphatase [Dysgonamonadaceae bacterium]|jgi:UDP-2,3-diacylglucosamine hydrolase|nr:UDP-2,3-diacylglucosamine diphosphatase [Dysgonamonadaceae bacterium]
MAKDKTYFVSDMHFGSDVFGSSAAREKRFVRWLDSIQAEVKTLYLLGDIFDFWFEYKTAVPRGFTRFLGKIAEMSDAGTEIHYFTGNHDIWVHDYLPMETGVILHKEPFVTRISGKTFYLAHGDGLGDESFPFKLIRRIFHNRLCRKLFSMIHPTVGIGLAHMWAKSSRMKELAHPSPYFGEHKEHLVLYAKSYIQVHPDIDYLIFGHRHILLDLMLSKKSRMMIIGDWLQYFSYAVFDGKDLALEQFYPPTPTGQVQSAACGT